MQYNYRISKNLNRILNKLSKKDKSAYEQILNKIHEIINSSDVEHYKNLRYDLSNYKRVHIGHFVLIFRFNKSENIIEFADFDHHDIIYTEKIKLAKTRYFSDEIRKLNFRGAQGPYLSAYHTL